MEFIDRTLKCTGCSADFVFTAGEQLFFFERQFKNDPKRCKLCKAKRAGLARTPEGDSPLAALPLSRTETRTECSSCGVQTTVPFQPTQGRPVFCRSCFQMKRVPSAVARVAGLPELPLPTGQAPEAGFLPASTVAAIAETPMAALTAASETLLYEALGQMG